MHKPQKIFFPQNVKFLRGRKHLSQEVLAQQLGITRVKLNAIESGKTKNPALEDLIKFSGFFKVSIDSLLKVNLSKLLELQLRELEAGNDVYMMGSKLRVLAISTDKQNNENMEYVPVKAKMGYKAGYNDPEYIASLPKFSLPNLPRHKTFRIFPSTGDSMLPIKPGTDFIAEYVEDWKRLKDTPCVLILKSAGADFVFKLVTWREKERSFLLRSLNEAYEPYTVAAEEVLEVWKYYRHITDELPEKEPTLQQVVEMVKEMKAEMRLWKKSNKKDSV